MIPRARPRPGYVSDWPGQFQAQLLGIMSLLPSKLLGVMNAVPRDFVNVLAAAPRNLLGVLKAIEQKSTSAE